MNEDDNFLNELQELSKQLPPENTISSNQQQQIPNSTINPNPQSASSSNIPEFSNDFGQFNLSNFFKNCKMEDTPELQENLNKLKGNLETITSQLKLSTQFGNPNVNNNNQYSNSNTNPFLNAFSDFNQEDFTKQFGSFSNEEVNLEELNKLFSLTKDYLHNDKEQNENDHKEMCNKVIDYMLENNLFSQVFTSMQSSIKDNFEKSKQKMTKEEEEQYKESLKYTENILEEASKVHPDKTLIIDYIFNLEKISVFTLQKFMPFNQ